MSKAGLCFPLQVDPTSTSHGTSSSYVREALLLAASADLSTSKVHCQNAVGQKIHKCCQLELWRRKKRAVIMVCVPHPSALSLFPELGGRGQLQELRAMAQPHR